MIFINFFTFLLSLFIVVKSADFCVLYSSRIARFFRLSEFIVSFLIIAVISVFPEASIAIISALQGEPSFGLGTLLGSNVADLTFVFGVVALFSLKGIRVKSEIIKKDFFYLLLLLYPLVLGFDGFFSRIDGIALILGGSLFFYTLSIESSLFHKRFEHRGRHTLFKNLFLLVISLSVLLFGSHIALQSGVAFAHEISLPPILIALTLVALGTCLPELLFSLRAVKTKHDSLALGDILGTVITDATIVLGIVVLIQPFHFQPALIYVTGLTMFFAGLLVIFFISSKRVLTKKHGIVLLILYLLFLAVEFLVNRIYP